MHATTHVKTTAETRARRVVHRTRGRSHGPITRLVSPSDVGELIKPFVFLDYFDIDPKNMPPIGFHPHSGIATVTVVLAPTTMNYLDVALAKDEKWRYDPPEDHTVAWIAVHRGKLATPEIVDKGELVVFEESNGSLEGESLEDTGFILRSA